MQKLPRWPWWVSFLVILVANYFLVNLLFPPEPARVPISYTFFKEQVVADNVADINSRGDTIQGTFRQAVSYQPDGTASATNATVFSTVQPQFADPGLETLLNQHSGQENPYLAGDVAGKPYSEAFAQLVDTEVQRILHENYAAAVRLRQEHRQALDALAEALIEHETLDRDEILSVTGLGRAPHITEDQKNGRAVPAAPAVAIRVVG